MLLAENCSRLRHVRAFLLFKCTSFLEPFLTNVCHAVHQAESAFDNIDFGANPYGLGFAAAVDWMHAMLEGLADYLFEFIAAMLKEWKLLTNVDGAARNLYKRTSHPELKMKTLENGFAKLGRIDANDKPGVLVQLAVVLGSCPPGHRFRIGNNEGLTKARLRHIQRMIYLCLRLCRHKRQKTATRHDISVECTNMRRQHLFLNGQMFDIFVGVQVFDTLITGFLNIVRDNCQNLSASGLNFIKFHSILHFPLQQTEFANLFFTDTNTYGICSTHEYF